MEIDGYILHVVAHYSTSNSNPKTESHLIFKQKPDKLMFGVSVCPDFMLALTIQLDDYCLQELASLIPVQPPS